MVKDNRYCLRVFVQVKRISAYVFGHCWGYTICFSICFHKIHNLLYNLFSKFVFTPRVRPGPENCFSFLISEMVLSTKNWIRFTRIDNLIPFTLLCPSQNNGLCDRYSRNHLQGLYFLLHLIISFYLAFLDIANTDTTASALKNKQPVIDSSQSPNPGMTGLHVFISKVGILAASNRFSFFLHF